MSAWIAETLVATTLLMAAVLLVRPLVRRWFGAGAAYALWLIPALRVALPSVDLLPDAPVSIASAPVVVSSALSPAVDAGAPWLFVVWGLGVLLFAGWHVVGYHRFLRRALSGATASDRGVALVTTDAVDGPAAAGLLTRRILLPLDFADRFDAAERDLAIRHELAHHARGDLWANAAALGMLGMHWFNPLAHRAYRAFREDQELACDAAVIGAAGPETRAAYAAAMVKSAQISWGGGRAPLTTCPMSRTGSIKRRLKMVGKHRKSALASFGGAMSVALLGLGGLTMTATAAAAADPVVKNIVVKRVNGQADVASALSEAVGERCAEGAKYESIAEGSKDGKPVETRMIFCSKDGASPATRLSAMTAARQAIETTPSLTAEQRERALAGLDKAIAETKAAQ